MSVSDPIADMLVKLKNASMVHKESVDVPFSKVANSILQILKRENYVENLKCIEDSSRKQLRVYLKYNTAKKPAITDIKRKSRPGLRLYCRSDKIPYVLRGKGIAIVSTSKGIMTDKEARLSKVGGEVLCWVW